jgi:peptidoglycan/LPS O-acetylase OafA/YrhL
LQTPLEPVAEGTELASLLPFGKDPGGDGKHPGGDGKHSMDPSLRSKPSASEKPSYIPSLDGLRAFSILVVFFSHAGWDRVFPGLFGVTVFFFLSGYLITTLLRREYEENGRISLGQFYLRRTLRIFPPLYITLGATLLLVGTGLLKSTYTIDYGTVLAQAFFLANYYQIFVSPFVLPGTEVFWSLAVEEHFYAFFPLCYIGLRRWLPRRRDQFLCLLAGTLLVLAWRCYLVYGLKSIPADYTNFFARTCQATDTRLDALLFGCMLAVYGNPVLDATRYRKALWIGLWLPISIVALIFTLLNRDPEFRETFRYTIQGLALCPVFIVAIRYSDWGIFRCLNWGWVRYIGVLSYTLYLTHYTIIACIRRLLPMTAETMPTWLPAAAGMWIQGALALAFSIGVAAMMYRFVEKPCARLRKRFSRVHATKSVGSRPMELLACNPLPTA